MQKSDDLVSVITVVYNGKAFIEDTIISVLNQTYRYVEYIVIDGGSTDGTVDIIKRYADRISLWISEKDKGIYDAMNKGIQRASGKWINFMNAGDYFYSNRTLEDFFSSEIDFSPYAAIYGDAEFRLKNIAYIKKAREESDTNGFMPFSHQAVFVESSIAKDTLFDLKYKITADTAFFLRLIKQGMKLRRIPVVVCSYDALQGMSVENEIRRSQELVDMQVEYNGVDPNAPYFKQYMRNARFKQYLRKMIPTSIWTKMREAGIKKNKKDEFREI